MPRPKPQQLLLIAALSASAAAALAQTAGCQAQSGPKPPTLVELYTSEGCNSCPPADRWLSELKDRPEVLAMAFHVDYWDRLGWHDRFGQADFSRRQQQTLAYSGARFAYTPQVIVNGRDWRSWPRLPAPASAEPGAPALRLLAQSGQDVTLALLSRASPQPGTTLRVWWVVLEDGLRSEVKAGENQGKTLLHDHVVREYGQGELSNTEGAQLQLRLKTSLAPQNAPRRRLVVVASEAATGKVLQALQLKC